MLDIDWKGLALPFAYVLILGGSLMTFSTIYRKRKASQNANLEPWFGPHLQRDIYLSLLHLNPEDSDDEQQRPEVPSSILKAALMRRAIEDLRRLIQIRTAKQACSALLQKGSVGDDLWRRFQRAEKEMEDELRDVVTEANALAPNWGASIFQSANEMVLNNKVREAVDTIQSQMEAERKWWDKRRELNASELMKELGESEERSSNKLQSDDEAVLVDTA